MLPLEWKPEWKPVGRSKDGQWAHDIFQVMAQVENEIDATELHQQELFQ